MRARIHKCPTGSAAFQRAKHIKDSFWGEAVRADLAVALDAAPKILLANEPTGEVDVSRRPRFWNSG